ncbi:DUF4232 domain-containing protein [Dactylosporangium sp. CS-033363]|uniref:DUF4232 domain-containing protein n=1 Tax=Dactylosporangium sp. CS-033363 TaxID=3239935 RepID=UPI003D8FC4D8
MDLEQLIRRELGDERHMPTGWAAPVERVQAGIRRRKRRRYTTMAAIVAGAVLAGVGVLALPVPGAQPAQGVIAWERAEASLPTLSRRSPRPDASPCAADDLSPGPWLDGTSTAADGTVTYTVLVPSIRSARCTLSGTPSLEADGADVPTGPLAPRADGAQTPATVDPGEPVRVEIAVTPCPGGKPSPHHQLAVTWGDGRGYAVPNVPDAGCGYAISPWYVQAPLLNAPLTVTMAVPKVAERGTTLVYQVKVTNTFPRAFRLEPCPAYRQGIAGTARTYRLNCAARSIPPHSTVTYEMRLDIPSTVDPGPTKVTWMAAFADGTVAIGEIATAGAATTLT